MQIIIAMLSASVMLLILTGFFLEFHPEKISRKMTVHAKKAIGINLSIFVGGMIGLLFIGSQDVMAANEVLTQPKEISIGLGLALIGIGLPTGFATIGAGIAVSSVGAASLAVITEKPEIFGRTLIYLGLAEGIAIYGLVVTILLLGKI